MEKQPTCEERIGTHLAGRMETFRILAAMAQDGDQVLGEEIEPQVRDEIESFGSDADEVLRSDDDIREWSMERMGELPLGVSTFRTWRIDLSTGGPGDWLEVQTDDDGEVRRIEYHFHDWFDHAARALDGSDYDAARAFAEYVTGGFYAE